MGGGLWWPHSIVKWGYPSTLVGFCGGPPLARTVASHDWPTRISPSIKLWTLFTCRRCNRVSNNKNPLWTLFACQRCNRVSNNKNPLWTLFACRRCNRVSNNKNPLWTLFACRRCNRCLIIKTRDPKLGNIKSRRWGLGGGGGVNNNPHDTKFLQL
jgi:hypothetical protein